MNSNKKPTDSTNLCSMSFLKVLKSKIKQADNDSATMNSDQRMNGLSAFNSKFRAATN